MALVASLSLSNCLPSIRWIAQLPQAIIWDQLLTDRFSKFPQRRRKVHALSSTKSTRLLLTSFHPHAEVASINYGIWGTNSATKQVGDLHRAKAPSNDTIGRYEPRECAALDNLLPGKRQICNDRNDNPFGPSTHVTLVLGLSRAWRFEEPGSTRQRRAFLVSEE